MLATTPLQAEGWTRDLPRLLVPSKQHFWDAGETESVLPLNWEVVICHRSLQFDHNHPTSALKAHIHAGSSVTSSSTSCPCPCTPADYMHTGQLQNDLAERLFRRWGGHRHQSQLERLSNTLTWNYICDRQAQQKTCATRALEASVFWTILLSKEGLEGWRSLARLGTISLTDRFQRALITFHETRHVLWWFSQDRKAHISFKGLNHGSSGLPTTSLSWRCSVLRSGATFSDLA